MRHVRGRYIECCGLLQSELWSRWLAVRPTVTVNYMLRALLLLYILSLHKGTNLTYFQKVCGATSCEVHKWQLKHQHQTDADADTELMNPNAPLPVFGAEEVKRIEGEQKWDLAWCSVGWDYFVHMLRHRLIYNSLQKGQVLSGWGHHTAGDKQTPLDTNTPHTHCTLSLFSCQVIATLSHLPYLSTHFLLFFSNLCLSF